MKKNMERWGFEFENADGEKVFLGVQVNISRHGLGSACVFNIMKAVSDEYARIFAEALLDGAEQGKGEGDNEQRI